MKLAQRVSAITYGSQDALISMGSGSAPKEYDREHRESETE